MENESNKTGSESLAEMTAEKQLEKLSLEIAQMKNKSKWHDRIAPYVSLLSVIITVGGFVFAIIQFQNQQNKNRSEQEKQRNDEIQKRYEENLEKLLRFTKDEKTPVAVVGNMLVNLKTQIREKAAVKRDGAEPTPEQIAAEEQYMTRNVSYMLVESIKFDCNLDNFRDSGFTNAVIINWDDIAAYLNENPDNNYVILSQHEEAIQKIYRLDSSVIKEINYDDNEKIYNYPNGFGAIEPNRLWHFQNLLNNYKLLYKMIENEKRSEMAAAGFQSATCNQKLAGQLLEKSFAPESRDELKHCLKK